jgi:ribonuclease G
MNKKMLVESDPHETRIALLEDDRLTELFIERHEQLGVVGNIYKGRVNRVLPGMQAAFVDIGLERDAFLYVNEVTESEDLESGETVATSERASIENLLRPGQEVVVQVLKDALPNKGARVNTQVTLPGRFLVLLPGVGHLGVSRRIEDEEERTRLRALLEGIRPPGVGLIVRTAGIGAHGEELALDLAYLTRLSERIRERSEKVSAPALIHRDLDLALRVARDHLTDEFSVVWVDTEETYARVVEFVDQIQPSLVPRVKLYQQDGGLLDRFGLAEEIEGALRTKVWLKSGGYIVIHPTEALVAIDVNTGRYVGHRNLEDTVLTTNLEAVQEAVRQIRLRNLGGIIVIDFIDMTEEEHRKQVFDALERELQKDRAKNKVLQISEFGLVELTRKRSRPSLERVLTQPCPYCRGIGRIKSMTTICLEMRRQLLRQRGRWRESEILLRVHPEVARALQSEDRAILTELETELRSTILVQSDATIHHEHFDILEV